MIPFAIIWRIIMGIWEIVGGSLLVVCGLLIVLFVSLQSDKSDGLSGAIAGGSDSSFGARGNSKDEKLASVTRILVIVFFVLTLAVNIFVLISDQICKPGSVEDGNLSRLNVAIQLQPRCGTRRANAYVPFGVAPDRVYMAMASPSCR